MNKSTAALKITTNKKEKKKKKTPDRSNFQTYYLLSDPVEKLVALVLILAGGIPLMLVFLYIKICKPGQDLFFTQQRFGQDNRPFTIIKFTTISKTVSDMPTHQLDQYKNCISKTGEFLRRTRINELPQLFNILTGSMKFVGPRPAISQDRELLDKRDELGLSQLKPGLAFIDRLYDDENMTLPQRMRFESLYLKKRSMSKQAMLDMWILLQSVKYVMKQAKFKGIPVKFRPAMESRSQRRERLTTLRRSKAA